MTQLKTLIPAAMLLAWLYNQGPNPDEVVVNDRWGKDLRSFCGDCLDD